MALKGLGAALQAFGQVPQLYQQLNRQKEQDALERLQQKIAQQRADEQEMHNRKLEAQAATNSERQAKALDIQTFLQAYAKMPGGTFPRSAKANVPGGIADFIGQDTSTGSGNFNPVTQQLGEVSYPANQARDPEMGPDMRDTYTMFTPSDVKSQQESNKLAAQQLIQQRADETRNRGIDVRSQADSNTFNARMAAIAAQIQAIQNTAGHYRDQNEWQNTNQTLKAQLAERELDQAARTEATRRVYATGNIDAFGKTDEEKAAMIEALVPIIKTQLKAPGVKLMVSHVGSADPTAAPEKVERWIKDAQGHWIPNPAFK